MTKEDNTSKKSKNSGHSDKSKKSKSKSNNGDDVSKDSKRSEIKKKKSKKEVESLGPPSDKEMKNLKRKSEMMEVKKETDDDKEDKEDKEKKEEKEKSKEGEVVVSGIQTTEQSPKSDDKTRDMQSGQELVPGEARQSVIGIKGVEFRRFSYTTIGVILVELILCMSALVYALLTDIDNGPKAIITINLIMILLSAVSSLTILIARYHVSLFETESQLKYAVTCARRFLLFSSHSLRLFVSLSTLTQSLLLCDANWTLFSLSILLALLSLVHVVFSLRMQPVIPPPC